MLTFCQGKHGAGIERAGDGAGLKAVFLGQRGIRTEDARAGMKSRSFVRAFAGRAWKGLTGYVKMPRPMGGKGRKDGAVSGPQGTGSGICLRNSIYLLRTMVCARSGPTDRIVIGVSSSVSRKRM